MVLPASGVVLGARHFATAAVLTWECFLGHGQEGKLQQCAAGRPAQGGPLPVTCCLLGATAGSGAKGTSPVSPGRPLLQGQESQNNSHLWISGSAPRDQRAPLPACPPPHWKAGRSDGCRLGPRGGSRAVRMPCCENAGAPQRAALGFLHQGERETWILLEPL